MKSGRKLQKEMTEALGKPIDYIEGEEAAIAIWNAAFMIEVWVGMILV